MLAWRILLIILVLHLFGKVLGQDILPKGLPFITYYSYEEYGANPQNWDIVQAQNGKMYIANGTGVLEYDGAHWRLIELPNKTVARSINVAENGTIYVGGFEDFGFLKENETGFLEYESLLHLLPDNVDYFQDIWVTNTLQEKVFFLTLSSIFILENNVIKEIKAESEFVWANIAHGHFFTHDLYYKLKVYADGDIIGIAGSERFNDEGIFNVLEYKDSLYLIITGLGNIFICDIDIEKGNLQILDSINNQTSDFINENGFYTGINYNNEKICYATYYGGIFMSDMNFKPLLNLSKSFGLDNNNIRDIYEDHYDNIWIAMDRGISLINMDFSMTTLNKYSNITGSINDAIIYDDPSPDIPKRLYVVSIEGLFYKDLDKEFDPLDEVNYQKFKRYGEIKEEVWELFEHNNSLLCASSFGTYEIKNNTLYEISWSSSWSFTSVKEKPEYLVVNLDNGLEVIKQENGNWSYQNKVEGFNGFVNKSVMDNDGFLWVEDLNNGINKIQLSENLDTIISNITYSIDKGLPAPTSNSPQYLENELKVITEKGIYRLNKEKDIFEPDGRLNKIIGNIPLDYLFQAPNKNIWYTSSQTKSLGELIYQGNGIYEKDTSHFNDIRNISIWNMYYYNDTSIFFCSPNGIILYNKNNRKKISEPIHTHICKVEIINDPDSIILINNTSNNEKSVNLSFNNNAIRFSFAATAFIGSDKNQFSYYLKGFDEKNNWSEWTSETLKEYNYLKEGKYVFHLKSRNVFMNEGNMIKYYFKVSPPFYRSIFAYIFYFVVSVSILYFIVKWNIKRLKIANIRLERKVMQRTEEIRRQNNQLLIQNRYIDAQRDELEELNESKDKFMSILAHDLKNPFTTILGFSELLIESSKKQKYQKVGDFAGIINQSAKSTHDLLDNLLSWSNMQKGTHMFEPQVILLKQVVDKCVEMVAHTAEYKNIKIETNIDSLYYVIADENMLMIILRNLITNALKFSYKGGKVEISAKKLNSKMEISIKDEGVGISSHMKSKLFDEEAILTTKGTNEEQGTGLGLLLCREFVRINQGKIWVESEEGKGSSFNFTLPIENNC